LIYKKGRFERLNLEAGNVACDRIVEDDIVCGHQVTERCFEQVQKAEKSAGFLMKKRRSERLNLEGGNVACDRL
jgi:hypothetical protein